MRCMHTMPFGAQLRERGGVDFRLWAPAAQRAELLFYPSAGGKAQPCAVEADREGWLGEVEGLQVSLAGANDKLAQLDRRTRSRTTVDLGIPTVARKPS